MFPLGELQGRAAGGGREPKLRHVNPVQRTQRRGSRPQGVGLHGKTILKSRAKYNDHNGSDCGSGRAGRSRDKRTEAGRGESQQEAEAVLVHLGVLVEKPESKGTTGPSRSGCRTEVGRKT